MDLLINNAVAVDLDTGRETKCAVWIEKGRIQGLSEPLTGERADTAAEILLDAGGAYILPGLIDFHTHLYTKGSGFGLKGDLLLSSGVTMAVDMGTAGCAGYEAFRLTDILPRTINIRSFLNLSPVGQPGAGISEPLDRAAVKEGLMEELITKYADEIRGQNQPIDCGGFGDCTFGACPGTGGALEAPGLCPHNGSAGPGGGDCQPPASGRYIQPYVPQ